MPISSVDDHATIKKLISFSLGPRPALAGLPCGPIEREHYHCLLLSQIESTFSMDHQERPGKVAVIVAFGGGKSGIKYFNFLELWLGLCLLEEAFLLFVIEKPHYQYVGKEKNGKR
ncbi:hypothetical protein Tco_0888982 [Tanacetum coccineum]